MASAFDALLEILNQFAFIGAVLGGFSVTLLAALLPVNIDHKTGSWAAGTALAAACLFILCTFVAVLSLIYLVDHPGVQQQLAQNAAEQPQELKSAFQWAAISFLLGIVMLLTSLGISGWTRSRLIGILSTSFSAITLILVFYFASAVTGLL